jgi:hypothetical protein
VLAHTDKLLGGAADDSAGLLDLVERMLQVRGARPGRGNEPTAGDGRRGKGVGRRRDQPQRPGSEHLGVWLHLRRWVERDTIGHAPAAVP